MATSLVTGTEAYWRNNNLSYRDPDWSHAEGVSLWETCPLLAIASDPSIAHVFHDDFYKADETASVGKWTCDTGNTPTHVVADALGGVLELDHASTDNDQIAYSSIAENWQFLAAKPLWYEARVSLLQTDAKQAVVVGMSDNVADEFITDGGAALLVGAWDGAVFWKAKDASIWQFRTSNGTAEVDTANIGAFASGTMMRVGFVFDPAGGTTGTVTPYFNGAAGTAHSYTLASAALMHLFFSKKDGNGTTTPLKVDCVTAVQMR